ncbi:MAG: adenylosuccinate synthetase [Marinirhabdus sp.]
MPAPAAKTAFFVQLPHGVPGPGDNAPLDLSNPADVIIYIVLPVLVVILVYIRFRRKNS